MNDEISILYDKIFRKNIDALMDLPDNSNSEQLRKLKDEIEIADSEQKITETQFNLLSKKYPAWKIGKWKSMYIKTTEPA